MAPIPKRCENLVIGAASARESWYSAKTIAVDSNRLKAPVWTLGEFCVPLLSSPETLQLSRV
jgi:hypothetical protein